MPKAKTKIKEILDGIDRDQADDGWWETSTGVEFGSQKLEEVLEYIEKLEEQVEQLKVAADPSLPADLETRAEYPSC